MPILKEFQAFGDKTLQRKKTLKRKREQEV